MLPIGIGTYEIAIIIGVIVVLFGARRIPELARSLGQGITEFKKAVKKPADEEAETSAEPGSKQEDE